jgi:ribosome biogenesis GTPase
MKGTALVVAAYGRRGIAEIDGCRRQFVPKGRGLRVVCGDHVEVEQRAGSENFLVTRIGPRTNTLARYRQNEARDEIVAANLTQLIAVCAPQPEPDLFLVDRFFCAAELMGCRGVLLWNKCDLGVAPAPVLGEYRQLGYRTASVSARHGDHIEDLHQILAGETSVLVGQSGAGKSSLVNALVPGSSATIGELSAATSTGTHTTTAVLMYPVAGTGRLLDTPGVRDFVPAIDRSSRLDSGFPDIWSLSSGCKFANCRHDHEPGCAVKEGLGTGTISGRRYESYRRLLSIVDAAS